ncbi:hypothetical protein TH66_18465 [Carbonactinospora thermoautotrophica]|uniref:NACHT N-terminal Helical domain-containing protein n=1 Tax=Carbonactinospora thermoautotrophica TaxID=1469144 RepID=A0A132NBT6_9ACTN|nr:leucine-rich repeat domain-containing protein [Carbonactinospora thermoautotrophica]KWW97568.1 hypothetical protein TH66_18465 [Carbonactinospora thermoautotrophica]KWX07631.1 hypothetical protein TR74_18190 [Carbonactinospora thermoautotrophica]
MQENCSSSPEPRCSSPPRPCSTDQAGAGLVADPAQPARAGLGEAATGLYDRLLATCCAHVVEYATRQPTFPARAYVEEVRRTGELRRELAEMAAFDEVAKLVNLPRLRRLDLFEQQIAGLYPLADIRQLQELEFWDCDLPADLTSLRSMPSLEHLRLLHYRRRCPEIDLTALAGLPNLRIKVVNARVRGAELFPPGQVQVE